MVVGVVSDRRWGFTLGLCGITKDGFTQVYSTHTHYTYIHLCVQENKSISLALLLKKLVSSLLLLGNIGKLPLHNIRL